MPSTNMQTFVRGMQMYPMRIMRSNNPQFDLDVSIVLPTSISRIKGYDILLRMLTKLKKNFKNIQNNINSYVYTHIVRVTIYFLRNKISQRYSVTFNIKHDKEID